MSSISGHRTIPNRQTPNRPTREEYEELGMIADAYWDSMVSIARYTCALEEALSQPALIERIRDDVGLDPMAAMVIDDPTDEEAA